MPLQLSNGAGVLEELPNGLDQTSRDSRAQAILLQSVVAFLPVTRDARSRMTHAPLVRSIKTAA
ncbi:MAG: hypothetical protein HOM69_00480 [Gammaproteobacteria bacterium]|nr:hypothetical protein [Gammaproteobacteria bacterium]